MDQPFITAPLYPPSQLVTGIVVRYINRVGLGESDPFECPVLAQRQAI